MIFNTAVSFKPFAKLTTDLFLVCEQFGVWVEKSMYGRKYMGIQRATFLSNEQGIITNVWEKVKVPGHAEDVLEAVKRINK